MTAPYLAAARFAIACAIGLGLGVVYSFLRPLRQKATTLGDLLFLLFFAAGWVYLGFAVCRGDLRLGYSAGLIVGIFLWEATLGRALRPVFFAFWRIIFRVLRGAFRPVAGFFRFFCHFVKKRIANGKKSGTIKDDRNTPSSEGERHGKMAGKAETDPICIPPQ